MGLFDFFVSKSNKPSIDLTDYKFLFDDHTRNENGSLINAKNKGVWKGISFKTFDNSTSQVSIYNMNENHTIQCENIQMAEKQMKLVN